MTAPTTIEESNARVSSKIDERFSKHSVRNIKNNSSQNNPRANIMARRRNLGGSKRLGELAGIESITNSKIKGQLSPTFPHSLASDSSPPNVALNLTSSLFNNESSLNRSAIQEQDETYMFAAVKTERSQGRNFSQKRHITSTVTQPPRTSISNMLLKQNAITPQGKNNNGGMMQKNPRFLGSTTGTKLTID